MGCAKEVLSGVSWLLIPKRRRRTALWYLLVLTRLKPNGFSVHKGQDLKDDMSSMSAARTVPAMLRLVVRSSSFKYAWGRISVYRVFRLTPTLFRGPGLVLPNRFDAYKSEHSEPRPQPASARGPRQA